MTPHAVPAARIVRDGLVPVPAGELLALAHEYEQAARLADADRLLDHVLAVMPDHPQALHLAGVVAYRSGRMDQALALMQRSIVHGIDTGPYYRNISEIYRVLGRHDEADEASARAVAFNPTDSTALCNRAVILADRQQDEAAIEHYQRALAVDPDRAEAHFGLSEIYLRRGDLERGWEEYEWRLRLETTQGSMPSDSHAKWDGRAIGGGTLLLVADQGLGDGIQFGRLIPWAAALAARIVIACSGELRPVLSQILPGAHLVAHWNEAGPFEAWCPLTGLPRLAGVRLDSIPDSVPYLRAPGERLDHWRRRLDFLVAPRHRRIGIVWAGSSRHRNDWKRSMPLSALSPVAAMTGVSLIVLQKGPEQQQASTYYGQAPLLQLSNEMAGFEDTMAIISALDLVLAVDTSVAHLAGAMGCPVWIMLPWTAEWRWLQHRPDSPWYPTARLFRQPAPGDWGTLVRDIVSSIEQLPEDETVRQPCC